MIANVEIWACDCEWGFTNSLVDHESAWVPVVFCFVGLRTGHRFYYWGRDVGLRSFVRDHSDDMFVSHNNVAEMKYLLRLGVQLPGRWFDTFVAERYLTNKPGYLEAGLSGALHRLNLARWSPEVKYALQQKILALQFDADNRDDREEIIRYCYSDCEGAAAHFRHSQGRIDPALMAWWCEYLKAVARMELRGIPVDLHEHREVQSHKADIHAALIGDINRTWPVFKDGSFSKAAFLNWCRKQKLQWLVKPSETTGKLAYAMDDESFKTMEPFHPFIKELRQVRKTLAKFSQRDLVVDATTSRHYFSTSAFRSVTGRNQPKNFIFSGPKWLRLLIKTESPDHVLVYTDYVAQEIGIAAALSGDTVMRSVYESSDCHMEAAIRAKAAPSGATKKTHPEERKRFKTVNLGTLYGQTAIGIAARLGVSVTEATELLSVHRALFPTFWRWSEATVQHAFDRGSIKTPCGWKSLVPPFSNERTWMNWPMQSVGGEIMRLTVIYLDRQNVKVLAPVHDGFLFSCRRDQVADLKAAVDYACAMAVEHVLPDFPLRWDFSVYDNGRFEDEDGLPLWNRLQTILAEVRCA